MKNNIGNADRIIRIISFVVVLILFLTNVLNGVVAYVLLGVTGILLITGLVNFCPIYAALGISTKKKV